MTPAFAKRLAQALYRLEAAAERGDWRKVREHYEAVGRILAVSLDESSAR